MQTDPSETGAPAPQTASIVIEIGADGALKLRTYCWGQPDCDYGAVTAARALQQNIPLSIVELGLQLRLGRRATPVESDAIRAALQIKNGTDTYVPELELAREAVMAARACVKEYQARNSDGHPTMRVTL